MDAALRRLVWKRAGGRCEYCLLPVSADQSAFCIDHVVAQKHRGPTEPDNLALSCLPCNSFKGDNIASIDPESRSLVMLFNPRTDVWLEHFAWEGPVLRGLTPMGRATVHILNINAKQRVRLRKSLLGEGHVFS